MARQESDREDLMREATALGRRAEWNVPGEPQSVIAGIRENGWLSLYFGPDPVYHFDESSRLRRAFVAGRLYRTQGTTLARLTRVRQAAATEMQRHDLNEAELADFRDRMRPRLEHLAEQLRTGQTTTVRSVPDGDDLRPEVIRALDSFLNSGQPLAPAVRGKR